MSAPSYETVLETVISTAAVYFHMDRTAIAGATGREDIDGWDSVSLPGFLLALEDALGVELPPDEAIEVETIAELAQLAHRQAAAR